MKEQRKEKLLRLWKIRQIAEGYDVSKVTTLEEADKFFENITTEEIENNNVSEEETEHITTLEEMKNADLVEIAKAHGLTFKLNDKKSTIIEAIRNAMNELETNNSVENITAEEIENNNVSEESIEMPIEEIESTNNVSDVNIITSTDSEEENVEGE